MAIETKMFSLFNMFNPTQLIFFLAKTVIGVPSTLKHRIVHVSDLPNGENELFRDSSFFTKHARDFPSPKEIRQKNLEIDESDAQTSRPPPVLFEELGLIVKYGSEITPAEAQCLWYLNQYEKDRVPTPELYGWCRDGDETFIYMELVQADTLKERWPSLSEEERTIICKQLRVCVEAWSQIRQETEPYYVGQTMHMFGLTEVLTLSGQIGQQGVGDIIFSEHGDAHVGPFKDITAFHDFFARYSCRRHPEWNPRVEFPELAGLTDDRPVVFTHGDLDKSNILISRRDEKSPPRVVAIIDWHQSGWYPKGWEWMKAQWLCDPLEGGYRDTAWLEQFLTPADDGYAYAWEYITNCW